MIAAVAIVIFFAAIASRSVVFRLDFYRAFIRSLPDAAQWLEQPIRWLILVVIGLWIAHRLHLRRVPREVGLAAPMHVGMGFAFLATLPMLVLPLALGKLAAGLSALDLLFSACVWPLAEEILYRGYAFRQLHRRAGWNLWLAAATTGAVFGAAHLLNTSVQGAPALEQIGTVVVIGLGGIWFAWLFARWDDNLWVPFGVHMFMNLWWSVFDMSATPLGGWGPNVLRALTLVLSIALTIYRSRIPILTAGGGRRRT